MITDPPQIRKEARNSCVNVEHRVWLEKICLVTNIPFKHSEQETYARVLLQEQLAMGWDGITKEVEEICFTVGLPNACKVFVRREEALKKRN